MKAQDWKQLALLTILFVVTFAITMLILPKIAHADGPVYLPGEIVELGCTNPTTRKDGTTLAPEEISSIVVYVSSIGDKSLLPEDPRDFAPEHIEIMEGGCTTRQLNVDNLAAGTQYWKYGITYDVGDPANNIAERVSDYTEPSAPFYTDLAKPNAPAVH